MTQPGLNANALWVHWPEGELCPIGGDVEVRHDAKGRWARPAAALLESAPVSALDTQEGGDHYRTLKIQPVEYIHANCLYYFEGNVIKYVTRWRTKGGIEDLKKARHYLDLLIELETRAASATVKAHETHPSPARSNQPVRA